MTDRGQNKQNKAVLILVRVIKTAFYNLTARLSFQGKLHGLYLWWWLFFFSNFVWSVYSPPVSAFPSTCLLFISQLGMICGPEISCVAAPDQELEDCNSRYPKSKIGFTYLLTVLYALDVPLQNSLQKLHRAESVHMIQNSNLPENSNWVAHDEKKGEVHKTSPIKPLVFVTLYHIITIFCSQIISCSCIKFCTNVYFRQNVAFFLFVFVYIWNKIRSYAIILVI